ncbi:MAG: glycosyltransferase family 39 protein [Bacteroidales bacterium]|nr:glycosyltransferase family 39 protein [Bacteroidales bacterium]MBN2818205.1 glycosyltransferase family 39 protein [Bacteroidales bacterium]
MVSVLKSLNKLFTARSRFSGLYFWLCVLLLFFIFDLGHILPLKPQSLHLWRQADCLSITYNYYADNNPFFKPSMQNLGNSGTGQTISDFPILYYFIAVLWKIFGQHELIYRSFVYLLSITSLWAIFKIAEKHLNDTLFAMITCFSLYMSPMYVYYSTNFLTNLPALSIVFIAWFFFWKYNKSNRRMFLLFSITLFTLAALLKVTSAFSFVALFLIFVFNDIILKKVTKKDTIITHPLLFILASFISFTIVFSWILYAKKYNEQNNGGFFLIGILPIWNFSKNEILNGFNNIKYHISKDYFFPTLQYILISTLFVLIYFFRKANQFLLQLIIISSVGFLLYIMLFYQAVIIHDYYVTNFLFLIPIILFSLFDFLRKNHSFIYNSLIFRLIVLTFLILGIKFSFNEFKLRYTGWANVDWEHHGKSLSHITPFLDSLGINKEDKILCISDRTINASLYYMNKKGWTGYGKPYVDSVLIKSRLDQGAKYIINYDPNLAEKKDIAPYLNQKIGGFNNIDIYKVSIPKEQ